MVTPWRQRRSWSLPTVVLILASTHLIVLAAAITPDDEQKPPITLPGCPDRCGELRIPYPFGTKPGCFLPGFDVTCNTSFNPPRAFLNATANQHYLGERYYSEASPNPTGALDGDSRSVQPFELVEVLPAKSELRVYGAIRSDCLSDNSSSRNHTVKLQGSWMEQDGPFSLSPLRNALVGVGLNVQPKMVHSPSIDTTTGYMLACLSYIADERLAQNGSCTGQGCCQSSFMVRPAPGLFGYSSFSVAFEKQDHKYVTGPSPPCTYGMVVETSWYNFSTDDMFGYEALPKKYPNGVPFVLDFAVVGASCSAPLGTGCSGNSSCTDTASTGGGGTAKGYVCSCLPFYQGNPYIPNGCQDINECSDATMNNCDGTTVCVNREGGYDCKCKPGMTRRGPTGPCTERFPLPAKIIVGLSVFVVVSVLMFMIYQILKLKKFYEQNGGPILEGVKNIRIYTSKQLKKITNNYKLGIGEGAFGQVYMGTLKNQQPVAIKKSIKVDEDRKKEFTDEVIIQSEMRHKNIVRLLGCCLELDVPMLVYEFVARGSLYDFLFKRRDEVPVDIRLKIAIGSAEGLTYMHSAGESTIRHGDVKSANILLDEEFNPKVSDFGTSSLLARGKDEMTERVIGDMSYIDPIYMQKGIVTQKSDVYSFGIVLIELITRRAATYDEKRSYIANFVQACQENRQRYFFDNDVTGDDDIKLLEMVSAVAVECLNTDPEERLDMKQVEHHLRGIIGQSAQLGQQRNYQGSLSPSPDDVALLN